MLVRCRAVPSSLGLGAVAGMMPSLSTSRRAQTSFGSHGGKGKGPKRRSVDATKAVVDDLFKNRSSRKVQAAMLRQRELEADNPQPLQDPVGKAGRTSRPVTFADDITDAEDASKALVSSHDVAGKAVLPIDDPDFSVLTDDAFTYFPTESPADVPVVPGQALVPQGMRRYRLELQFRGDHYLGWDRAAEMRRRRKQLALRTGEAATEEAAENVTWAGHSLSGLRSVKDAVDEALAVALDAPSIKVVPAAALETGVHGRRLTCHVDIPADTIMQSRTILQRAHAWLVEKEEPLGILSFQRASPDFHAAASVRNRVYLYRMLNRISPAVLETGQQWHVDRYLDVDLMQAAATNLFHGTHDFGAFASRSVVRLARHDSQVTVRDLAEIRVTRQDDEVHIWFVGKSFLRHQIRHMVGALKYIGQRVWTEEDLRLLMDRGLGKGAKSMDSNRPPPAPAHGLTLWEVQYAAEHGTTPAYVDSGPIDDAMSRDQ